MEGMEQEKGMLACKENAAFSHYFVTVRTEIMTWLGTAPLKW